MTNMKATPPASTRGVSIASELEAKRLESNNNPPAAGVRVTSRVKAGFHFVATQSKPSPNHNQAVKGLRVKSRVKAGGVKLTDLLVSG